MTFKHYLWERFKGFFTKKRFKNILKDIGLFFIIGIGGLFFIYAPITLLGVVSMAVGFAQTPEQAYSIAVGIWIGFLVLFTACAVIKTKYNEIKSDYKWEIGDYDE